MVSGLDLDRGPPTVLVTSVQKEKLEVEFSIRFFYVISSMSSLVFHDLNNTNEVLLKYHPHK